MADYQNTDVRGYVENGLTQVMDLINRRNYNPSVAKARQVAERLVKSYAEEKNVTYTSLAETIEQLYSQRAINITSRDAFHSLRLYGNKAAQDGNCTEEDARNAYYYLNGEVQTWKSRNNVSMDRTPVRVDRSSINNRTTQSSASGSRSTGGDTDSFVQTTPVRRRRTVNSQVARNQTGRVNRRRARVVRESQDRSQTVSGPDIYSILKVLIPIVILILIIVILVSLFGGGESGSEDTTPESSVEQTSESETETQVETTAETETEPVIVEYQIRGNNVNIRYAENTDRIYDQLNNGDVIGPVQDVEGTNYAQFTMDGLSLVVSKDYIEPVGGSTVESTETSATEGDAEEGI